MGWAWDWAVPLARRPPARARRPKPPAQSQARSRARRQRRAKCLPNSAVDSMTSDVVTGARGILEQNWREGRTPSGLGFGYTCPDPSKYPDQFFWDSCFHALAWSRFDPSRAMLELRSLAAHQLESGL